MDRSLKRRRLENRLFSQQVIDAAFSPLGIVLAGAGAAVGIVAGLPIWAAAGLGAAAWGTRVAVAVPRAERRPRVDPNQLGSSWRGYVIEAMQAKARYDQAVRTMAPGPMRGRLELLGERIEQGVAECYRVAARGQDIDLALQALDTNAARTELRELEVATRGAELRPDTRRTMDALRSQVETAERLAQVSADARDRLRLLDARLDELVARAVELSLGTGGDVRTLGADVDDLVNEMEALRSAVEETDRAAGAGGASS